MLDAIVFSHSGDPLSSCIDLARTVRCRAKREGESKTERERREREARERGERERRDIDNRLRALRSRPHGPLPGEEATT